MGKGALFILAGISGFTAVVAGALEGHYVASRVSSVELASFAAAGKFHMYHSLALLALAAFARSRKNSGLAVWIAAAAWASGTVLFSGSIYLKTLSSLPVPGLTPVGGLCFMVGWIAAGFLAFAKD